MDSVEIFVNFSPMQYCMIASVSEALPHENVEEKDTNLGIKQIGIAENSQ